MQQDLFSMGSGFQAPQYQDPGQDANGYYGQIPTPDYGANPWSGLTDQALNLYNQADAQSAFIPQYQAALGQRQDQMNTFASNSQAYPTFPNTAGLGSQQPLSGTPQGNNGADPSATSRGFNPWSLSGEALSR